ncbi:MAG: hypothetical protein NC409_02855 [Clostridium sp.]|nr:hypothetical protein [Clostridium sp.]
MMKLLFVLPSGDTIYGSGRSAAQLARALNLKFDLVVGRSLIHQTDEEKLRESFGSNLGKIHSLWLPNANYYYGKSKNFFLRAAAWHKYFMWLWNRRKFKKIICAGAYTAIHLNSMILAPMVRSEYRMILHVREVFEGSRRQRSYLEKKLRKAHGVIYINPSTRAVFDNRNVNEVIIQDPFEMTHLAELDVAGVRKRLDLRSDNVIFAILGRYEDRNGTEFIVNTFHKMKSDRAVLLVVGHVSVEDSKKIERVTEGDSRIRILGEWEDPGPIFAISDYILRGERFFCGFSRTVYEGLYSGCRVIFPGRREEAVDSLQYDTFCDSLIFYPPRDEQELIAVMEQCAERPVTERNYLSNREEYVSAYLKLLESF